MVVRFERLVIPLAGWAVIYWVIYSLIDYMINREFGYSISIKDLLWQISFGHSEKLNTVMWYQVNLIYITLIFLLIVVVFKKNYQQILWMLGLTALIIQYSGLNMLFSDL